MSRISGMAANGLGLPFAEDWQSAVFDRPFHSGGWREFDTHHNRAWSPEDFASPSGAHPFEVLPDLVGTSLNAPVHDAREGLVRLIDDGDFSPSVEAAPQFAITIDPPASVWPSITTTGSAIPIYTVGELVAGDGAVDPLTNSSGSLVKLDDFRADARFASVDGAGFASVILDTGIDLDHPFFGSDLNFDGIADRIVYQYDFADGDSDASDVNGHGSNVSSIIGSQDSVYGGMAPGADIIALKVFKDSGAGYFSYIENALQWVVNNAAAYNIVSVNMSLGDSSNFNTPVQLYGIADEMAALAAQGVIVVSAAGNGFYGLNSVQGVSYPAADPNSLAIGATYDGYSGGWSYGSGAIAYNTGADVIAPFSQRDDSLTDVFAPGAPITGANAKGGTITMHGTSQASPHVAGIAVLAQQVAMQELGRKLTFAEFQDLIKTTGATIFDGDDENDNVTNTNLSFSRIDMMALAEAIYDMADHGTGTEADDTLTGTSAADILDGLGGNDLLIGAGGDDTLLGGTGNDRLEAATNSDAEGSDILDGGAGDDTLYADASDTILGGTGTDTLIMRSGGGATGAGVAGMSVLLDNFHADVENVFGGQNDDIIDGTDVGRERLTLRGSDGNDVITGGAYRDRIFGGNDDDILSGGGEGDYLKGENGNDWLDGGAGNDEVRGGAGMDIVAGGEGNDIVHGGADGDTLLGGAGNDRLYGSEMTDGEGSDLLDGGLGDDKLYADASDTVLGGDGYDQLIVRGLSGMSVDLAAAEVEETWGGAFDDMFDGSDVTGDSLLLRGGAGDDHLIGGALNDKLYGGDDDDLLEGGGSNDYLKGENGDDTLSGGAGNDRLRGGSGNDLLDGGLGKDDLTGDGGADIFANTAGDGITDNITDYNAAAGDAILNGASYTFNGSNTYVYDGAGNLLFRLNGYDADTDGINYA